MSPRGIVTYIGSMVLSLAASGGSYAQPWLEDGLTCFCLKHETGQLFRNCTGVKPPTDAFVTATCKGGETGDQLTLLTVQPPWTPIRDGDTGCNPCRNAPRATKELPRGQNESGTK